VEPELIYQGESANMPLSSLTPTKLLSDIHTRASSLTNTFSNIPLFINSVRLRPKQLCYDTQLSPGFFPFLYAGGVGREEATQK
jgi:hypothetical protein